MQLVSVITPTYNRAGLVKQAIRSVLAQTYPHLEMLIVDDGSTDDTKAVVQSFSDSRLKYIWQPNQQRCVARNNGIANASGELIALLDSDDLWFPDKLQAQVDALNRHPEADVVFCGCARFNDRLEFPYPYELVDRDHDESVLDLRERLLVENQMASPSVVVGRTALLDAGEFDASLKHGEDWDMWIRLSAKSRFCRMSRPLAAYRVHCGNRTANPTTTLPADLAIINKHHCGLSKTELRTRAEMSAYIRQGFRALVAGHAVAAEWLKEARARVLELDCETQARQSLAGAAVGAAGYTSEDRASMASSLSSAAETLFGARDDVVAALHDYWMALACLAYSIRDYHTVTECCSRIGITRLNRGLRSMYFRSAAHLLVGPRNERMRFPLEEQLPGIVLSEPEEAGAVS